MSETQECPFCAEEIKAAAIKCKHCGSMVNETPPASSVRHAPPGASEVRRSRRAHLIVVGGLVLGGGTALGLSWVYGDSTTHTDGTTASNERKTGSPRSAETDVRLADSGTASADWNFAEWGMAPSEVVKASKGKAMEPTERESKKHRLASPWGTPRLTMPWQSGNFQFRAYFYFDKNDRLDVIRLQLRDGSGESVEVRGVGKIEASALPGRLLVETLKNKYGEPHETKEIRAAEMRWFTWRTHSNEITCTLVSVPGKEETTVTYKPRETEETKGL